MYTKNMTETQNQPSNDLKSICFVPTPTSMIDHYDSLIDDIFLCSSVGDIRRFFAKFPSNWVSNCSRKEEQKIKERAIRLKNELSQYFTDPYIK